MDKLSIESPGAPRAFPIIGIGASSGGLEAILELLGGIKTGTELAILVVQHLDPSRPSLLTEIFSGHTTLRVHEAADAMLIEAGNLYVIPPNMTMAMADEHITLTPRNETLGTPTPIDDLFQSMATSAAERAIGIILSGSGTDGAIGIQAIKECGGITFAQDDNSARYNSMPRAAVKLGCIDFVMNPIAIAAELMRIVQHPLVSAPQSRPVSLDSDQANYERLFDRLNNVCNIDFSHYKRGTIDRRLSRRLVLHGISSLQTYVSLLDTDEAEVRLLCREFLINFTHFFRDPETFDALATVAFPRILQDRSIDTPIRVWVPGCSTGEEAYSLAICLTEYLANQGLTRPLQIFGTDICDEALDIARTGLYLENIARNVSAERLARFFVKEGEYFRVTKVIRDCCIFARQNVAYDPPFSRLDLLSCRNLLIYLEPLLQKRLMPLFHFSLVKDGILLLGTSETIGTYSDLFTVIDNAGGAKLFAKKWRPGRVLSGFPLPPAPSERVRPPPTRGPTVSGVVDISYSDQMRREVDTLTLDRYAPASVLCDQDFKVLEFRGDTSTFLVNPKGPPTTDLRRLARAGVLLALSEAIRDVRQSGQSVVKRALSLGDSGDSREFSLEIVPLRLSHSEGKWFLVFFRHLESTRMNMKRFTYAEKWRRVMKRTAGLWSSPSSIDMDPVVQHAEIARLLEELQATRSHMSIMLEEHEAALGELKSVEEETLSSNEEFQSANEELETTKEELQSLNEELSTTNDELRYRNSELKQLHEVVSHSRDYSDAIVDTMAEPLLVLDSDFRIERANRAFYEMFQTSPRDTLNANLYVIGNGQWDIPSLRDLLEELLPQRTEVRDHEITAYFPKLGRRTMRLNAVRIAWPEQSAILMTVTDITAHHQVLERLMHGDRQKDEFLAMLGHELRNPLASMGNALQLLKHPRAEHGTKEKAQQMLERQLLKQIRLVDELLDVSRINRGVVVLKLERFDLAKMIENAVESLAGEINGAGHVVRLDLPTDGLMIEGDTDRLEQVVTNLIVNAVKYTPPNGVIELQLRKESGHAVFSVSDNGFGMSAEFLTRIFTVFAQADTSFQKTHGGLGIGLALVRRIVELHGGTVRAESRGLGQGSRFVLSVPLIDPARHAPHAVVATIAPPKPAATPKRILLVDDNRDAAESLAVVLQLEGHETYTVFDALASLDAVERFNPEVVLLDIGMPGLDGYEICRRMRLMPGRAKMVLIAISGYGSPKNIEAAHQVGFDHHLTKPADLSKLAGYINS